jgi:hypothetical protein
LHTTLHRVSPHARSQKAPELQDTWQPPPDGEQMIALVGAAVERGVTLFDRLAGAAPPGLVTPATSPAA